MIVKILPFLMLLAATHQAATNTTALSTDHAAANQTSSHPVADSNTVVKTADSEVADKTHPVTNKTVSAPVATDKTHTVTNVTNHAPAVTGKEASVGTDKTVPDSATNKSSSVAVTNNKTTEAGNKTVPTATKQEGSASNTVPAATKNTTGAIVSNSTTSVPIANKPSGPALNKTTVPSANKLVTTDTASNKTSSANKTTSATAQKSEPSNKTVDASANKPGANKTAPSQATNKSSDGKGIDVGNHLAGVDPDTLSCDPLGQIFLLLPHFTDCSKFFMCAHGAEVEFSCAPGGLYFDFEQQICDFSWRTRCWLRTLPGSEIEGSGEQFDFLSDEADNQNGAFRSLTADTVANSVRPLSVDTQKSSSSPLNCLRADSASKLVPYKGDCQRYWRCANGVAQSVYCNDGLFFNERTQQCDFEANVRCLVEQEDELKTEFILYKTK